MINIKRIVGEPHKSQGEKAWGSYKKVKRGKGKGIKKLSDKKFLS